MSELCGKLFLAGWLLAALAGQSSPAKGRYTIDVFGTVQGLPSSAVLAVLQARDGYLWLGTPQGLARFDGVDFTVFDANNTPELRSSRIVGLFEDSERNLWILTENAGVALVRQGRVHTVDVGRVSAIDEDKNGAVWLYSDKGRLYRYRDQNVDEWHVDSGQAGLFRGLAVDAGGLLWIGSGINLVAVGPLPAAKVSEQKALPVALEPKTPIGRLDLLVRSKQAGYWRLADFRIQKWNGDQKVSDWAYPWKTNTVPYVACEDLEGNLVVGTIGEGVYWFDPRGEHVRISTVEGLNHGSAVAVTVDREGCLWVGTNGGGLNRVKRQAFGSLDVAQGKTVQSVCEDQQGGGLWIGYNWDRIDYWSPTNTTQLSLWLPDPTVPTYVKTVFVDKDRRVRAGTWNFRGPHLFQWQGDGFRPLTGSEAIWSDVSAVYEDPTGVLWVGTQGGLVRWDKGSWKAFTTKDGLAGNAVRSIVSDGSGALWVGTDGQGVNRFLDGRFSRFTKADGLPGDDINSLYVDREGVLWAGTAGGVGRFEKGSWAAYTKKHGLISNSIGYIIEDDQGYLWLGSNAGLMRVHKDSFRAVAEKQETLLACRAYGEPDGLPSSECTFGSQPGAVRTRDGQLFFPTTRGLAHLDPAQLRPNTNAPLVLIEAVMIDGRLQNTNKLGAEPPRQITVPAQREALDIKFTSLNLATPDKGRFRYRLEGHETAWTEGPWNLRVAHYTKVPHGEYRFQVAACNEDNVWNDAGASLAVIVLPPFWRTWWFIGLMTALLLGIVVGSVYYVATQRLQRQLEGLRQQEALEKERSRISRDLHDQLGANLTQVALLGELAETDKDDPAEVEAHARQIAHTARDTTRALDEIVWTVNPANDTLEGLINYLCKYAQEYFAIAGMRYRLDVPDHLPATPISPELRHHVFLAAKEAVNNVVKHAHATSAWLRLRLEPGQFQLEIEDNGKGVSGVDEKTLRSGLRNMRRRMEDVGGKFEIGPGQEAGTLVKLTVPLKGVG